MTAPRTAARRTTRLRALLDSSELAFLLEAHNGLSARIVEEAGFAGIWASGLALSAQYGVRDNNEASWTQVLEMAEFMADATSIPILLDGDTGYGNFNNLRRLVRKLEQRGVAGVCIEDKEFPKTNSFLDGERQPLADVDEFCGKIKAGKDSQTDRDFCLVARVEALIAGWDMSEALRRAEAYRRAGADAILIHSKRRQADEIVEFAREWAGRAPLVIVPTKYYSTPTEVFRKAGISLVIWANHLVRAATQAMQQVAAEIRGSETLVNVEDRVSPLDEIFRLQGAAELTLAEQRYEKPRDPPPRAIVLAASRGEGLEAVTEDRPKVMLAIAGKPLLRRLADAFRRQGVRAVTVVGGYRAEAIDVTGVEVRVNPAYATSGELASLAVAGDQLGDDFVLTYGDLLFRRYILRDLLEAAGEIVVVVDSSAAGRASARDLAWCSTPDERSVFGAQVTLRRIGAAGEGPPSGRWIGMLRARGADAMQLRALLAQLGERADFPRLGVPDLLNALVDAGHVVRVLYVHGHWLDVNDLDDLRRAADFAHGQNAERDGDD